MFKCQNLRDGLPYVLRRVESSSRTNIDLALQVAESWKQVQHSGVISLREVFRSSRTPWIFGCKTNLIANIFFAYDYYPGSETLEAKYFSPTSFVSEDALWSIIVQLISVKCDLVKLNGF